MIKKQYLHMCVFLYILYIFITLFGFSKNALVTVPKNFKQYKSKYQKSCKTVVAMSRRRIYSARGSVKKPIGGGF